MKDWNGPMKWIPGGYTLLETVLDQLEYARAYSFTATFAKEVAKIITIRIMTPTEIPPQMINLGFILFIIFLHKPSQI